MDYNALSAWAAVTASLIAIIALIIESRRTRFQVGVDIFLKFNDRFFENEAMKIVRRKAANGILTGKNEEVDDVLDFFEEIGLLLKRKAIDEKFVWHSFYHWVHRYYFLTKSYVDTVRKDDDTIWEDFVWLHDRISNYEKKRRNCSDQDLDLEESDLKEFLQDEMNV